MGSNVGDDVVISNNVIDFVSKYTDRLDRQNAQREEFEDMVDDLMEEIIVYVGERGYSLENDHDLGLLCETIRSSLMRTNNDPHILQEIADHLVEIID
jgi:hypothetical protein